MTFFKFSNMSFKFGRGVICQKNRGTGFAWSKKITFKKSIFEISLFIAFCCNSWPWNVKMKNKRKVFWLKKKWFLSDFIFIETTISKCKQEREWILNFKEWSHPPQKETFYVVVLVLQKNIQILFLDSFEEQNITQLKQICKIFMIFFVTIAHQCISCSIVFDKI